MDVKNGYFLIKSHSKEDYEMVLTQGPWTVLGFLHKRQILEEIGGLIRKVTKLDFQTDKGLKGKFARMVDVAEGRSTTTEGLPEEVKAVEPSELFGP
ncbi:hypothetical protein Golob_012825 [Gossypium lobatum]|uniref:DUF4283 domain-containing protein n=1 Tax=Gossypium lobatum TaxID=34289 RepID=A0A7J8LMH8_9ROSI|nr:hypothetical protein [Gossypium lobatum]